MTTVAWDGRTLAADRQMGGWFNVPKLFRLADGRQAGGCGDYDAIQLIYRWLDDGASADRKPDIGAAEASVLVVDGAGVVVWYIAPLLRPHQINEPFMAIGSGESFALGAMAAGANARRAVEIACRFDPTSGQGIDAVRVVKSKKAA